MTYNMGTAILMKGGSETGNTFVGFNDFQLGDDITTKMHHGHYSYYSKAIVKNEKNIMIAHNVFASGYVGGNDRHYADKPSDLDNHTGSTVVMMVPYSECEEKSNPLHIFHRGNGGENHACSSADFYRAEYNFNEDMGDDPLQAMGNPMRQNDLCWQGHQVEYTNPTLGFSTVTRNTGHWGPHVYPGCAAV